MGKEMTTWGAVLCLALVALASGEGPRSCEDASRAVDAACDAFGGDSEACEHMQQHYDLGCGDLGESDKAQVYDEMLKTSVKKALKKTLVKEETAAVKGDTQKTIDLANEVYDRAAKVCMKHAKKSAKSSRVKLKKKKASVRKLEKSGKVPKKLAKKLPRKMAKRFAKLVKKEQMKKPARRSQKGVLKRMARSLKKNALRAKVSRKAAKLEKAGKKGASTLKSKVKRRRAKKKAAKVRRNALKMPSKKVKKATNKWKKKGRKEHVTNINKMMKALPAGKGLRRAFRKIESSKGKPAKKSKFMKGIGRKKFARQVKKMATKIEKTKRPGKTVKGTFGKGMKGLTKEM